MIINDYSFVSGYAMFKKTTVKPGIYDHPLVQRNTRPIELQWSTKGLKENSTPKS